jgi:hypothetical protein
MGYSISWCAVREQDAEALLQQLGLTSTGEAEEQVPRSLICAAKLDTGWRIIWCNKYTCPFLRTQNLRDLSTNRDLLFCQVEEHVMASSSEMWSRGARVWRLSHQGDTDPRSLDADGALPESFASIRQQMEEEQRTSDADEGGVDYIFEIPLRVAQALVGFMHDEDCPHLVDGGFVVLSRNEPSGGGWFRRLFGK